MNTDPAMARQRGGVGRPDDCPATATLAARRRVSGDHLVGLFFPVIPEFTRARCWKTADESASTNHGLPCDTTRLPRSSDGLMIERQKSETPQHWQALRG